MVQIFTECKINLKVKIHVALNIESADNSGVKKLLNCRNLPDSLFQHLNNKKKPCST